MQSGGARNGGRSMTERGVNAIGLCIMLLLMIML
jgi:hypothetical protein